MSPKKGKSVKKFAGIKNKFTFADCKRIPLILIRLHVKIQTGLEISFWLLQINMQPLANFMPYCNF